MSKEMQSLTELKEQVIEQINNCDEYKAIHFINCFLNLLDDVDNKCNEQ